MKNGASRGFNANRCPNSFCTSLFTFYTLPVAVLPHRFHRFWYNRSAAISPVRRFQKTKIQLPTLNPNRVPSVCRPYSVRYKPVYSRVGDGYSV